MRQANCFKASMRLTLVTHENIDRQFVRIASVPETNTPTPCFADFDKPASVIVPHQKGLS